MTVESEKSQGRPSVSWGPGKAGVGCQPKPAGLRSGAVSTLVQCESKGLSTGSTDVKAAGDGWASQLRLRRNSHFLHIFVLSGPSVDWRASTGISDGHLPRSHAFPCQGHRHPRDTQKRGFTGDVGLP